MTYARARLWLGISGVGFWVTLSCLFLWNGLPARVFSTQPAGMTEEIQELVFLVTAYILLSAPFDFLGGYWLPRRFRRSEQTFNEFFAKWLRGVTGQALVFLFTGAGLLAAGRAGGRAGALVAVVVLMLLLLAAQGWLARLIGGLGSTGLNLKEYNNLLQSPSLRLPPIHFVQSSDPAFVGGFTGLPGHERLILPAHWGGSQTEERLSQAVNALQIVRRAGVLERGSRLRGVVLALVWNALGFSLATQLPGAGVTTVAELATTAFGFTLWSFVGLLVLPSFSRPAVLEADDYAARHGVPDKVLKQTIAVMDKWQDDEPERTRWIETIFHPIPSVNRRLQELASSSSAPRGAWQAARVALFLSWSCWGLLGRAVHCNSGRPELWVLFPGD